jgi:hypothetical protein
VSKSVVENDATTFGGLAVITHSRYHMHAGQLIIGVRSEKDD